MPHEPLNVFAAVPPGVTPDSIEALCAPLQDGVLWFAGDHTSSRFLSSAQASDATQELRCE
jgi:hypothetical protein